MVAVAWGAMNRPWLKNTMPVNERVALLLSQMTLDEKVAQLTYGGG